MFGLAADWMLQTEARGLRWLDRAGCRLRPHRQLPSHLQTGNRGEREALMSLRRHGYTVVARRWTSPKLRGDLDLVAWHGDTLCFLEIKTRTERNPLDPAEAAVNRDKKRILRRLAWQYLRSFPPKRRHSIPVRFDIVAVYLTGNTPEIEILPAAFGWRDPSHSQFGHFGV